MTKAARKKLRRIPRGYVILALAGLGWILPVALIVLAWKAFWS